MERLKAILADKVLDLSIGNGDEVKAKVDKIQRFRDFANACQTLMKKYPSIEDELIKMVESGDFDTKVASSRVDTVIRLADTEAAAAGRIIPQDNVVADSSDTDDFPMEIVEPAEDQVYTPEDIEYEELEPSADENTDKSYVSYEDIRSGEDNETLSESGISLAAEESGLDSDAELEPDTVTEAILSSENKEYASQVQLEDDNSSYQEDVLAAKRKLHIRRTIQIVGIVVAVVALIFIIKFVMIHWQTILIVAGILAVLAILFVWFKRKRK